MPKEDTLQRGPTCTDTRLQKEHRAAWLWRKGGQEGTVEGGPRWSQRSSCYSPGARARHTHLLLPTHSDFTPRTARILCHVLQRSTPKHEAICRARPQLLQTRGHGLVHRPARKPPLPWRSTGGPNSGNAEPARRQVDAAAASRVTPSFQREG